MFTRSIVIMALLSLGLVISAPSALASAVAQVVKVTGEAWVSTAKNDKIPIKDNDAIPERATITTAQGALVFLLMNDKSIVKVGASSKLELSSLAQDSDHVEVNLQNGVAKCIVTKKTTENRWFRVQTPAATMGVRGTEFTVSVSKNKSNEIDHQLLVAHGSVQVSNKEGRSLSLIKAGMGCSFTGHLDPGSQKVSLSSAPIKPQRLSSTQLQALSGDHFLAAPKDLPPLSPMDNRGNPIQSQPGAPKGPDANKQGSQMDPNNPTNGGPGGGFNTGREPPNGGSGTGPKPKAFKPPLGPLPPGSQPPINTAPKHD